MFCSNIIDHFEGQTILANTAAECVQVFPKKVYFQLQVSHVVYISLIFSPQSQCFPNISPGSWRTRSNRFSTGDKTLRIQGWTREDISIDGLQGRTRGYKHVWHWHTR